MAPVVLPSTVTDERLKARARNAKNQQELKKLLARELHDRVAQTLTTMLVELENFKSDQAGRGSVIRQVDQFQDSTRDVLNSLRQLLYELREEETVGDGFVESLGELVERFQEKTSITTQLKVLPGWPTTLHMTASRNLFRIIEEALTNVRNYSGATKVMILLQPLSESELAISVTDDGRGFEADVSRGFGMLGMRERAMLVGGELSIDGQSGSGTTVSVNFPRAQVSPTELLLANHDETETKATDQRIPRQRQEMLA